MNLSHVPHNHGISGTIVTDGTPPGLETTPGTNFTRLAVESPAIMELTRDLVEEKAREYRDAEPFDAVEREHVEIIPETFSSGDFGWRDAEWVVQWYYRRYRGAYPD